jgi:hypothetical protein
MWDPGISFSFTLYCSGIIITRQNPFIYWK